MKKLILVMFGLALMARCFAPILDPRMGHLKPQADPSQATVTKQQSDQKEMGVVGSVPANTDPYSGVSIPSSDATADSILQGAAANSDTARAKRILQAANSRLHEGSTPMWQYGLWGLLLALAGYGGFRLLVHYMTRNMGPVPAPNPKRVTW